MSKSTKKKQLRPAQKYERKESYLPHEVLDFLPNPDDYPRNFKMKTVKKDYDGDLIKMASQRYYTFAKSLKCEFCDLTGSVFYKEKSLDKNGNPQNGGFHFNLYAINEQGEEVLMTKDHMLAKSCGGTNTIKNYTTCCSKCNSEKASMGFDEFKALKEKEKNISVKWITEDEIKDKLTNMSSTLTNKCIFKAKSL